MIQSLRSDVRVIAKVFAVEAPLFRMSTAVNLPPHKIAHCGCFVLILSALSLVGCHGINLAELDFTRSAPAKTDIVGQWIAESTKGKQPATAFRPKLTLRQDGTFSVIELPTSVNKEALSGSGVWKVDKDYDGFAVWVINLDFANHHRETIHLMHQEPPYLIYIFMDDPDSGRAKLLKRVR